MLIYVGECSKPGTGTLVIRSFIPDLDCNNGITRIESASPDSLTNSPFLNLSALRSSRCTLAGGNSKALSHTKNALNSELAIYDSSAAGRIISEQGTGD
jgi:hypothetical protein